MLELAILVHTIRYWFWRLLGWRLVERSGRWNTIREDGTRFEEVWEYQGRRYVRRWF